MRLWLNHSSGREVFLCATLWYPTNFDYKISTNGQWAPSRNTGFESYILFHLDVWSYFNSTLSNFRGIVK